MHGVKLFTGAAVSVLLVALAAPTPVLAETMEDALVRAYQDNPQLNAQRAQVRSTDENVPQALSGYRPRVSLTGSVGYQYLDSTSTTSGSPNVLVRQTTNGTNAPRSAALTVSQTLYTGNQTANKTRAAEILSISYQRLLRRIKELEISDAEGEP